MLNQKEKERKSRTKNKQNWIKSDHNYPSSSKHTKENPWENII